MAHGNWLQRAFLPTLIIVYQALWPTVLFSILSQINKKILFPFYRDLITLATLFMYWFIIHEYALYPVGGNLFMHPLVLLVRYPSLLWPLQFIGPHLTCIVFLLPTLTLLSLMYNQKTLSFLTSFIFISYLVITYCQPPTSVYASTLSHNKKKDVKTTKKLERNKNIITLPLSLCTHNPQSCAEILINKINKILKKQPKTELIVLPESAINCDDQQWIKLVAQQINVPLIVGTFTQDQQRYNSALFIKNKTIKWYHKQQLLPFVEQDSWIASLFHHRHKPLTNHHNQRPIFIINNTLSLTPYICSELFFASQIPITTTPIIALCNDTWFYHTPFMQQLMLNIILYKKTLWQNEILYISYHVKKYNY
jgi:apolipoprotein N-acyltransferase